VTKLSKLTLPADDLGFRKVGDLDFKLVPRLR